MMAEGTNCSSNCSSTGACPGVIVANFVSFVQSGDNFVLDYSLVLLPTNITAEYGYLQVRESGAVLGERIYLPQHPNGWGKRIALVSTAPADTDGFPHIYPPHIPNDPVKVGTFADVRPGSSGSPIISYEDHLVVALLSYGSCPTNSNGGPNINHVIEDLVYIPHYALGGPCNPPILITNINSNTVYDTDRDIPGDIHVHSGAELHIKAKIGMKEGMRILVERNARLVVDNGGIITKGCDAPYWTGIQVLGNSQKAQPERFAPLNDPEQAGIVWLDRATVEWARCGVTAGGGYGSEFWGGLVWTNLTTFQNNRKDVEFMSYKFTTNRSRFFETTFSEIGNTFPNTEGVTIWETNDIEFHNCTFKNMDFEGIRTYDAGIRVLNDCRFEGNQTGISAYATYPMSYKSHIGSGSSISNKFTNNTYHIDASLASGLGGSLTGKFSLDVINNDFSGGSTAVSVDGPSNFRIAGNFVKGGTGCFILNTGFNNPSNQNFVGCNKFQDCGIGIAAWGNNDDMQFLSNDFELKSGAFDSWIIGSIRATQGNKDVPAGNCFTAPGAEIDINTVASTNTNPFIYYYEAGEPLVNCEPEPLNPGAYTKIKIVPSTIFSLDCDKFGGLPPGLANPTQTDLNKKRDTLSLLLPYIAADENAKNKYYKILQEKDAILQYLIEQSLSSEQFSTVEGLLAGEQSKAANWAIFGLRMGRKDYTNAAIWLNQLPIQNNLDTEFRDVQLINLQRLQNPDSFQLSEAEDSFLNLVAESNSAIRGYARGILGILKDQHFYPDSIGTIGESPKPIISDVLTQDAGFFRLFPVPANRVLNVSLPKLLNVSNIQLLIIDVYGKQHINKQISPFETQISLGTTQLSPGVYWLVISAEGQPIHQAKFSIQH